MEGSKVYEFQNIFTTIPRLAGNLVTATRSLNISSLQGACDLPISESEINKFIQLNNSGLNAIITYNHHDYEARLDVILYMKMNIPEFEPYNLIYKWYMNAYVSDIRGMTIKDDILNTNSSEPEQRIYLQKIYRINNLKRILSSALRYQLTNLRPITDLSVKKGTDGIHMMDVISVFQIFKMRQSCVDKFENYGRIKTLQHFNDIVFLLNTYETIHMLTLYLLANALVLNLNLSEEYWEINRKFSDGEYAMYEEIENNSSVVLISDGYEHYVKDVTESNDVLIGEIQYVINQF